MRPPPSLVWAEDWIRFSLNHLGRIEQTTKEVTLLGHPNLTVTLFNQERIEEVATRDTAEEL